MPIKFMRHSVSEIVKCFAKSDLKVWKEPTQVWLDQCNAVILLVGRLKFPLTDDQILRVWNWVVFLVLSVHEKNLSYTIIVLYFYEKLLTSELKMSALETDVITEETKRNVQFERKSVLLFDSFFWFCYFLLALIE